MVTFARSGHRQFGPRNYGPPRIEIPKRNFGPWTIITSDFGPFMDELVRVRKTSRTRMPVF